MQFHCNKHVQLKRRGTLIQREFFSVLVWAHITVTERLLQLNPLGTRKNPSPRWDTGFFRVPSGFNCNTFHLICVKHSLTFANREIVIFNTGTLTGTRLVNSKKLTCSRDLNSLHCSSASSFDFSAAALVSLAATA